MGGVDPRRLASRIVRSADGPRVGRVRDIYLADRTSELAAISVTIGRTAARHVLVPADLIEQVTGEEVRVRAGASSLRAGRLAPATGHVEPEDVEAARRALAAPPRESVDGDPAR